MMPPALPRKPEPENDINTYIPSFIAKKPFYVADEDEKSTTDSDYLEHQRLHRSQDEHTIKQQWYDRGKKAGPAATKFRKGACENCGAISHKTKECLSRPRKQGAKWTGADIQADEVLQDVNLSWDAKRDRWNGYDPKEYASVVEEFRALEETRRRIKLGSAEDAYMATNQGDNDESTDAIIAKPDDGIRYGEDTDMGRNQAPATRNLRIREDTAKYLLNLDLDSAKYDPKTRSMVDAGATLDAAAALVADEEFMRASGDAAEFEKAQRYAWEQQDQGGKDNIHLQANPTSGEYNRRQDAKQTAEKRQELQKSLFEKYGNSGITKENNLRGTAVVESARFIEYDDKGREKVNREVRNKSQYAEDVMVNNHKATWGSWWMDFVWGYACCHSSVKNSYCIGGAGRKDAVSVGPLSISSDEVMDNKNTELPSKNAASDESWDASETVFDPKARKRKITPVSKTDEDAEMKEHKRSRFVSDDLMVKRVGHAKSTQP